MGCSELPEFDAEMRKAVSRGSPARAGERRMTARWSTTIPVAAIARPMPRMMPRVLGAGANQIKEFIKTSTSSMTAVPKPLKFLRPHYASLEKQYEAWSEGEDKVCESLR